ncbi:hypothetical protein [Oceanithermus sp.]|uniref:hypothetical protein n=1 Tax=Oceanithermus sp. TaxID=2268145 RepID=UPI00257ACAFD|nr:hypothetical protein [Oceanithermus sp.]
MTTEQGSASKASLVNILKHGGMEEEVAEKLVDVAAELVPAGVVLGDHLGPLEIFMRGAADAYTRASAAFLDAADELGGDDPCDETRVKALRFASMLLKTAGMMAEALAESAGGRDQRRPLA